MGEAYTRKSYDYYKVYVNQVRKGFDSVAPFRVEIPGIQANVTTWTNQLDGFKQPGWKALVAQGSDATTAMTASNTTVDAKSFTISVKQRPKAYPATFWEEFTWEGDSLLVTAITSIASQQDVRDRVRNRALSLFLKRAKEVRSSVEGGQNLGEWKQILKAITNPLGAMRTFVFDHVAVSKKRYRRTLRRSGPKAAAKLLSDTYLEFVFGWNPLSKDVGAAIGALQNRYNRPEQTIVSGSATENYSASNVVQAITSYWSLQIVRDVQTYGTYGVRYRGSIRTGAVDGVMRMHQVLGLAPERFLPTIWELIPYSFVVDYFANIGAIVESFAFQRSNLAWGHETIRTETTANHGSLRHYWQLPNDWATRELLGLNVQGGSAVWVRKTVQRNPISSVSLIPTLEFTFPIRVRPWLNIAALLGQALRP